MSDLRIKADTELLIEDLTRIVKNVRTLANQRFEQDGMATTNYERLTDAEQMLEFAIRQLRESMPIL